MGSPHWHLRLSIEPPLGRRYLSVTPHHDKCAAQQLHMSRTVRIFQVDAFTDTRFCGNPAGVVLGAETLTDAEMQCIARELNNGDTAFVLPPGSDFEDIRVRFFTPRKEAPFVGHATLAAHAVLSRITPRPLCRQGGRTGVVEVRALPSDGGFTIRQSAPPLGRSPTDTELHAVLDLLGLQRAQLDPRCPPCIAGAASTRLLLGVRDATVLDVVQPQLQALGTLSGKLGAQGYFLFTLAPSLAAADTEARMFCPALGIDEDPVSGNAHGMLGVYLQTHGLLTAAQGRARFTGVQGRHVGRPGQVGVEVETDAKGGATAVSISGRAVTVFETELRL
jgi:PhzF family phenazine biosynthesis protein